MKDFHLFSWLLTYDLSKASAKLVISLKHNIIFAKFVEMLLDNNVILHIKTFVDKVKIIGLSSLYFSIFY